MAPAESTDRRYYGNGMGGTLNRRKTQDFECDGYISRGKVVYILRSLFFHTNVWMVYGKSVYHTCALEKAIVGSFPLV